MLCDSKNKNFLDFYIKMMLLGHILLNYAKVAEPKFEKLSKRQWFFCYLPYFHSALYDLKMPNITVFFVRQFFISNQPNLGHASRTNGIHGPNYTIASENIQIVKKS